MRKQIYSLVLIGVFVFTSVTVFGADASDANKTVVPTSIVQNSNVLGLNYDFNMEYCTVDLDNPSSNLNVRTWEGRVTGKLRHGTRVWVNEYSGEWARVSVKRGKRWVAVGWVDSSYLYC